MGVHDKNSEGCENGWRNTSFTFVCLFFFFLFQQITILLFRRSFSMLLARTLLCFFFFFVYHTFFLTRRVTLMVFLFFFSPIFCCPSLPPKKKKKGDIRQVATKLSKLVESVLRHIYLETRRELELQVTHLTKEERKKKKQKDLFGCCFRASAVGTSSRRLHLKLVSPLHSLQQASSLLSPRLWLSLFLQLLGRVTRHFAGVLPLYQRTHKHTHIDEKSCHVVLASNYFLCSHAGPLPCCLCGVVDGSVREVRQCENNT